MRDSREPQTEGSVSTRSRSGRRPGIWRRPGASLLAVLLPLVLVLAALLAPVGEAHQTRERTPEEEAAKAAAKQAEREQQAAEKRTQREQQAGIRSNGKPIGRGTSRENGSLSITCTQVIWKYKSFPDLPGNTVTERITIGHAPSTEKTFTFDGPEGTDVVPINAPPGPGAHAYHIDGWTKWHTNGVHGGFDIPVVVKCAADPALEVEKLQKIAGASATYTSSPLGGQVGQTVDYEVLARNTGNVPLSLGAFSDAGCDAGTITGGPGGEPLTPGATAAYLCTHLLNAADATAGSYPNTVSLTATPPQGEGSPVSQTSNTVLVEVTQATPPSNSPANNPQSNTSGSSTPTPSSGTLPFSSAQPPRSGVLAFSSTTVPRLQGPQGCVRGKFHASVKSAGVASVSFYLDGHKLRRMTAHSARRGLLSITIDPTRLNLGPHRLLARITMVKSPTASRAVSASRTMTVLRCASAAITPKFTG